MCWFSGLKYYENCTTENVTEIKNDSVNVFHDSSKLTEVTLKFNKTQESHYLHITSNISGTAISLLRPLNVLSLIHI